MFVAVAIILQPSLWILSRFSPDKVELLEWRSLSYLAGVIFLFAFATLHYILHPIWQRRYFLNLRLLENQIEVADETIVDSLRETKKIVFSLADRGCVSRPRILVDADFHNSAAAAFGIGRKKNVAFGLRLVTLATRRPEYFSAVSAHELGHIAARDITLAFYSKALIIVSISTHVVVFLHFLYIHARSAGLYYYRWSDSEKSARQIFVDYLSYQKPQYLDSFTYYLVSGLSVSLVSIIGCLLLYRGLLRTRESYADVFSAAIYSCDILQRLLLPTGSFEQSWRSELASIFKSHPTPVQRIRAVADPVRASRPRILSFSILIFFAAWTREIFIEEVDQSRLQKIAEVGFPNGLELVLGLDMLVAFTALAVVAFTIFRIGFSFGASFAMRGLISSDTWNSLTALNLAIILSCYLGGNLTPNSFYTIVTDSFRSNFSSMDTNSAIPFLLIFNCSVLVGCLLVRLTVLNGNFAAPGRLRWLFIEGSGVLFLHALSNCISVEFLNIRSQFASDELPLYFFIVYIQPIAAAFAVLWSTGVAKRILCKSPPEPNLPWYEVLRPKKAH